MVQTMKDLLQRLFIEHWQRKAISLLLAIITWLVVNHSMTATKILSDIPVKIINLPAGKTIEGLQQNNILSNRIALTLTGNKNVINELTPRDLEVIIDASNKGEEWIVSISKKNLISFNPDIDVMQSIHKVEHEDFIVKLSLLATARIPIYVEEPEGEPPPGYEFLGVWPNELFITLSGSEKAIQTLKTQGISFILNLDKISLQELEGLSKGDPHEVISFSVPDCWKFVEIPALFSTLVKIDDPSAAQMRIDFIHKEKFSLGAALPIHLFCSAKTLAYYNPSAHLLEAQGIVEEKQGIFFYTAPLFVHGVSRSFFDLVKNKLQMTLFPTPEGVRWIIEPQDLQALMHEYVIRETNRRPELAFSKEYFIDQFQKYLRSIRFYQNDDEELLLEIELKNNNMLIVPKKAHP